MRILRTTLLAAAAAAVGAVALAPAAQATPPQIPQQGLKLTAKVISTPDDGCPVPWARDTFTRTTMIFQTGQNQYKVKISDSGKFITAAAGAPAPNGGNLVGKASGSIEGSGEYTVTGALKNEPTVDALNGKTYDNTSFKCKTDVPADAATGTWPKKFFEDSAQVSGIKNWKWTYLTPCEKLTESESGGSNGNITGKACDPKVVFVNVDCKTPGAGKLTVTNINGFAAIKVKLGTGAAEQELAPGQIATTEVKVGTSVQVYVGEKKLGAPYQATAPKFCPPVVVFTPPTCQNLKATVVVTNTNPTGEVKIQINDGTPVVLAAGTSHTHEFTSGVAAVYLHKDKHRPLKLAKHVYEKPKCTSPSPSASASKSPSPSPSASRSSGGPVVITQGPLTPVGNGSQLPLTGVNVFTVAGVGLAAVILGLGGWVLARRRKPKFTA